MRAAAVVRRPLGNADDGRGRTWFCSFQPTTRGEAPCETAQQTVKKLAATCVEQAQKLSPGAAQRLLAKTLAGKDTKKKVAPAVRRCASSVGQGVGSWDQGVCRHLGRIRHEEKRRGPEETGSSDTRR